MAQPRTNTFPATPRSAAGGRLRKHASNHLAGEGSERTPDIMEFEDAATYSRSGASEVSAIDSGSVKERLLRASRALPTFSFNRVRDLFYADPRARVGGDELDYLRSKVGSANLKAAQDEYAELGKRVARLEALLSESENHRRSLLDAGRDAAGLSHRTMGRGQ